MGNNNKISTKFEIERTENEDNLKLNLYKYKAETYSSIEMKLFTLN